MSSPPSLSGCLIDATLVQSFTQQDDNQQLPSQGTLHAVKAFSRSHDANEPAAGGARIVATYQSGSIASERPCEVSSP